MVVLKEKEVDRIALYDIRARQAYMLAPVSLWVISYVSTAAAWLPEKLVIGDTFPVWMSGHACPWQLA